MEQNINPGFIFRMGIRLSKKHCLAAVLFYFVFDNSENGKINSKNILTFRKRYDIVDITKTEIKNLISETKHLEKL